MSNVDIQAEVEGLKDLDLDGLRLRWRSEFGRAASQKLNKPLLRSLLAYRLQARTCGDLASDTRRLLKSLSAVAHGADVPLPARGPLGIGTTLVREHGGRAHHVQVAKEGFVWNGETYPSLSKVAFAITGTRWNGPKFFGLREAKP